MKIVGVIVCIISAYSMGIILGAKISKRYYSLKSILKAFLGVKGELMYNKVNLDEVFMKVADRTTQPLSEFFYEVCEKMNENAGSFEHIWKNAIDKLKNMELKSTDIDELLALGNELGYLGVDMQTEYLDIYIKRIQEEILFLKENKDKSIRLYKTLGILAGIMVSIVFV